MNLDAFDAWAQRLLDIPRFRSLDDSLNGVQVGRSDGDIAKIAFAVDACAETIARARDASAQVLFVHHGLFWGKPAPVRGVLRERIAALLQADMALFACHLPLDAHPVLGNNAVLARMMGLVDIEPFGEYHGVRIGFRGTLPRPVSMDALVRLVLPDGDTPRTVLHFGTKEIRSVAVVSGGAPFEALQAIAAGVDAYVTGEPSHSIYHEVEEAGFNVIAAGHYATEVHGVRAVADLAGRELGLRTTFIGSPTGL